jgi:hypothetical protein
MLKSRKEEYIVVDYNDLNDFVSNHYGKAFNVVEDWEMSNDSYISFNVSEGKVDKYDLEEFIEEGSYSYLTRTILIDLCNKGLINPGKYLIEVSW